MMDNEEITEYSVLIHPFANVYAYLPFDFLEHYFLRIKAINYE